MGYEVRWTPRAQRQAEDRQVWWLENRLTSHAMFRDELAYVLLLLQDNPELGVAVRGRRIRRLLMLNTKHFVYYRVLPRARCLEILALWSTSRRGGPPLPPASR